MISLLLRGKKMKDSLSLKFPNKKDYIPVARLAVSFLASLKNLDLDAIEDLRLIITEACNLCYFINGQEKDISLEIDLEEDKIFFKIPFIKEEKVKEDDRYLMSESIISSLADGVAYQEDTLVIRKDINGN